MARGNTTSGSDGSGVGQRYSIPVVGGSGDSTKPFTISWSFNLSALDTTNKITWIDKSSSASTGSGYGQGLTITQNSLGSAAWQNQIDIFLHDDHGSGWGHFRQVQYRMGVAPSPLTGTYPFPDPGVTYVYTLVVDSATGTTDYSADDPADTNYTTVDLYMSPEGGTPQTWTPETDAAGASMNGTNGVFDEQVLFASSSLNQSLQGSAFSFASWVGRALTLDEITALHKGYSPLHFPENLYLYNDQVRNHTTPTIRPPGLTVTDANSTVQPHAVRLMLPRGAVYYPPAFAAMSMALPLEDAVAEYGVDLLAGDVLGLPLEDAVTEYAVGFVTGYTSPLVGIRDLLKTAIEGLTPPGQFDRTYVAVATFAFPDGLAGHRMFSFEATGGGSVLEFGAVNHQVEHEFQLRVRLATSTESLDYIFQDVVDEAMKIQALINRTSFASVAGADFVSCDAYDIEETTNEDHDIVLTCRALTQETS